MNYKLDNINISSFGAYPKIDKAQECIAVSGIFDLPKRKGNTEYNWGTLIEPFVESQDMEFDGRTITLNLCVEGNSYKTNLRNLKTACINCRKLTTDYGVFDVIAKDEITVDEYENFNIAIVNVKFWQQNYIFPELIIKPSGGDGFLLDGYNCSKDFDLYVSSCKNAENIAKRIDINTTLPYTRTLFREARDITLECSMTGNNLTELYSKMMQFHALCVKPGIHTLQTPENRAYNIYFKDGISVKAVLNSLLKFNLKCRTMA